MTSAVNRLQAAQRLRWERQHVAIRCALQPAQPALIRVYLGLGRWLVRQGQLDDAAANQRMLRLLLDTASDAALPWFWRSVCLEHTTMPAARLSTLLHSQRPDALQTMMAHLRSAQQALALAPHKPS